MHYTLDDHETASIYDAVAAAYDQAAGGSNPVPGHLLHSQADREVPAWLLLCHQVLVQNRFQIRGTKAELSRVMCEQGVVFDDDAGTGSTAYPALPPARIAALAAGCAPDELPGAAQPADLQEALLQDLFTGHWPPHGGPRLDLTQLLASPWVGPEHRGRLARLEMWLLPPRSDGLQPAHFSLLRAPGALLLPVDDDFAEGLHHAQRLLRRVLQPGAPSLAWNLRPLAAAGQPHPAGLGHVAGSSASATLAWASLYLLRDHLRSEFADLASQLHDSEPATLTITAALDGPIRDIGPDEAFNWPRLVRVGGVDDKFAALQQLPIGRVVSHRYVAHDQHSNAAQLQADKPLDLAALAARIADECNGGLDVDARALHRHLVSSTAPFGDMALLERVSRRREAPASIKAYLVWRYARRASGSHTAFGDPVRLDQFDIRLALKTPDAGHEEPDDEERRSRADETHTLDHLLHTEPHSLAPAWCVESPPFCGKTTLLASREMATARWALQDRRHHGRWGEVSVFLPMRAFEPPRLPPGADAAARLAVVDAFVSFVQGQAPGLPPLEDVLAGRSGEPGLRWRLLVDGLNELRTAGMDERRALVALICTWLQQHQGPLLPPVFTVRELENGLDLASAADPRWRARRAVLQPWRRSDWAAYIGHRQLAPQARQRLHDALRLQLPDAHGSADDTPFERFCRSPGILAAQCTLLSRWPGLLPPRQRGTLFLALLWHCLDERGQALPEWLLPSRMRGPRALDEARRRNWQLPAQPGVLLDQLRRQADAMQDAQGWPQVEVPAHAAPPGLQGEQAEAWRQAVTVLGLAAENFDGHFAFAHQQWLEFFAALGCGLERPLPPLEPPALDPPDEAALEARLKAVEGSRIDLPAANPHQERMRFAVELATDRQAWLRRLLREGQVVLAARAAVDLQGDLEPQGAFPGRRGEPPNPVLQHLRRVLLLRSMDAGARVIDRLRAGCVVGEDETHAALSERMAGFDDELDAHWAKEWQHLMGGQGRDIRHRIEAGLLLGELHDNLRYEYVAGDVQGRRVAGLRLKAPHWLWRGKPGGPQQRYRIGNDTGGQPNERPSWTVVLPPFQVARYAVTNQEWEHFIDNDGYDGDAPWWQVAGSSACAWLKSKGGRPYRLEELPNFLRSGQQPVCMITALETLAYAAWADLLDTVGLPPAGGTTAERLRVAMPTEVLWEAAVTGPDQVAPPRVAGWVHGLGDAYELGPLDFNHGLSLEIPAPVGCYSLGSTPDGMFDTVGNVHEWCSNALTDEQLEFGWRSQELRALAQVPAPFDDLLSPRAMRGGALVNIARQCRPAYRARSNPGGVNFVGVRLVRLPHSEPRAPATLKA